MINLIKLHFSYLYSWKIIYIILIILVISMISFIFLSSFYLDKNLLIFYQNYYQDEYVYSSVALIKILILVQSMYIVINGFVINKYDVYLVLRNERFKVIVSKVISMTLGIVIFTIFLFLLMNLIGLFLTPYYRISTDIYNLLIDLIVFGILYTLLYIFFILTIKNMYSLLFVFIFYFISNISLEYLTVKSELSAFAKLINLVFTDVGYFKDIGYDLFYSNMYYLALIFVLFELIIVIYNKSDILN